MGARRLYAFVRSLPQGAALWRAADPEGHGWTGEHELLAMLVELTDAHLKSFIKANAKRNTRVPDPIHIPRPWDRDDEARRNPSPSEVEQFFIGTGGAVVKNTKEQ